MKENIRLFEEMVEERRKFKEIQAHEHHVFEELEQQRHKAALEQIMRYHHEKEFPPPPPKPKKNIEFTLGMILLVGGAWLSLMIGLFVIMLGNLFGG